MNKPCLCGPGDKCVVNLLPGWYCKITQCAVLERENVILRRSVLNQCGDELCWIEDLPKAKALPKKEFLESCRRYLAQITSENGEFTEGMTIAQLEARVRELEGKSTAGKRLPVEPPDPEPYG